MRIFKLDPSSVTLPEWPSEMTRTWEYLGKKAASLSSKLELGTAVLNLIPEVERIIDERKWTRLKDRALFLPFSRALVHVWTTDAVRRNVSLAPDTLSAVITSHRESFPRPLVFALLRLHLTAFSHLRNVTFEILAEGVLEGAKALSARTSRRFSAITAVANHPEKFLLEDAPVRAAREIVEGGITVNSWLEQHRLRGLQDSTYVQAVRYAVLLEQIGKADPNDDSSIALLQSITTDDVIYAPWHSGKYFGHEILRALIERPTRQPIEFWVNAIIGIAGDPRIEHSASWREWWRGLDQSLIDKTKKWLAERDLNLFLAAIEQYAHETGDETQVRQFRSRHKFLLGLLEHDIIRESRLILGRDVRRALREQIHELGINPALYKTHSGTSIIALDCGAFQMVEGTHNFTLRFFQGDPLSILTNHAKRDFALYDFTRALPEEHRARFGFEPGSFREVRHLGLWQHRALDFVVGHMGIELDIEKMMSQADYQQFRRNYSFPLPGRSSLS